MIDRVKKKKRFLDIDFSSPPTQNRRHLLLHRLNIAMIIAMLSLLMLNIVNRYLEGTKITFGSTRLIIVAVISFINIVLLQYNKFRLSKYSLIFLPVFIIFILPSFIGFVEAQGYFYYPYAIIAFSFIPALTLDNRKETSIFYISLVYYFILLIVCDLLLSAFSPVPLEIVAQIKEFYLYYKVIPVVIFLVMQSSVYYLRLLSYEFEDKLYSRNRQIAQQKNELEERNEEIAQQRDSIMEQKEMISQQQKDLMDSINFAEKIQKAVLPTEDEMNELLPDHFVFYRPRDIVSGDFYWIGKQKSTTLVAVADSTGHGVPGAFMSMLGISMIEEVCHTPGECSTGLLMNALRSHVISTLKQTGESHNLNIGMDMSLLAIDRKKGQITFTGAYHNLYLFRKNNLTEIKGDWMSVGMNYASEASFREHSINYVKGDTVYMLSDGFPDQFGGKDDKKYGYPRLKKFLAVIQKLEMEDQKKAIALELEQWQGEVDQIDDIVLMGIRL